VGRFAGFIVIHRGDDHDWLLAMRLSRRSQGVTALCERGMHDNPDDLGGRSPAAVVSGVAQPADVRCLPDDEQYCESFAERPPTRPSFLEIRALRLLHYISSHTASHR
jgi:hypothetical protein